MSGRMEGKKVLVTGAATGIGRGMALEFAAEGADVAVHHPPADKGAGEVVDEIRKGGTRAEAFEADFNEIANVKRLSEEALSFLGGLDVLINNAGVTHNAPIEKIPPEQFDFLYNVNVRAGLFLIQYCLPALIESRPSAAINLSSVHAFHGMTEHAIYAGTKGAIVAYAREVALELAPKGVRLNTIAPGWIYVENQRKLMKGLDLEETAKGIPVGFIGEPKDVGRLAIFLASEEARYITGQTYVIDGGQMSIMPNTGDFRERREWVLGFNYLPDT